MWIRKDDNIRKSAKHPCKINKLHTLSITEISFLKKHPVVYLRQHQDFAIYKEKTNSFSKSKSEK